MIFVRFRGVLRPWSRFYREYEDNLSSLMQKWLVDYLQIKHTWIETWKEHFFHNCQIALKFFFKSILSLYLLSSCDELYIFHYVFSRFCINYSLSFPLFPCQLITFANSLDPVQYKQNVGSDQDTDDLRLW